MKLFVELKPRARKVSVEQIDIAHYKIEVNEPPIENRANAALIHVLARHLKIPPTFLKIIAGHTSRKKTISIKEFLP